MGLNRREFLTRIGQIREIDPMTQAAYDFAAWQAQSQSDRGAAAKDNWHLSFHGSQFPGDNDHACGRQAIYRMMDIPRGMMPRWLEQVADAGKDIEDRLVMKWYNAGYLLSPPPFDVYGRRQNQMVFEDSQHWLTSTVDSLYLHPRRNRPAVCEVKSQYAEEIEKMLRLCRGPDPKHVFQLRCQIAFAHEIGPWKVKRCHNSGRLPIKRLVQLEDEKMTTLVVCPEHGNINCLVDEILEPANYGYIYYVSRDDPYDSWEFFYEYDPAFMEAGRQKLEVWRKWFLEGLLPAINFEDKRFSHPFNWTWTRSKKDPKSPCEWCDYGDICREDHKAAVAQGHAIKLTESAGIRVAQEVREDYNFDLVKSAILRRWGADRLSEVAA